MSKRKWNDEQLISAVANNKSIAGVIRDLGLIPAGGNYSTVNNKIKELNLDTSHFTGQGWNVGLKFKPREAKPLSEILVENSNYQSYSLAKRLLKEGFKEHKCERCMRSEWEEVPIPLELHHLNGVHNDNRLNNLQLLCPNCHALTDNYRGKNMGMSAQKETSEVEPCKFEETLTGNADGNLEPSQKNCIILKEGVETRHKEPKSKESKYCAYCGIELLGKYKRNKYCSQECAHKANSSKRPDVFTLLDDFKKLKSFLQVGKKYGVSDNAVRKWCKLYGILDKVKE
jgi:hypothetical protein